MYNFKEITSVNNRYIFLTNDRREVVKVNLLHEVIKDINLELNHYNFMYGKMTEAYDNLSIKMEELEKMIAYNNKLIESNINKPIVRRGLSEYHDNLRYYNQALNDIGITRGGVFTAYDHDYVARLRKLSHSCKVVVNQSEFKKL